MLMDCECDCIRHVKWTIWWIRRWIRRFTDTQPEEGVHVSCYVITPPLWLPAVQPNSTPRVWCRKCSRIWLNLAISRPTRPHKRRLWMEVAEKGKWSLRISKEAVLDVTHLTRTRHAHLLASFSMRLSCSHPVMNLKRSGWKTCRHTLPSCTGTSFWGKKRLFLYSFELTKRKHLPYMLKSWRSWHLYTLPWIWVDAGSHSWHEVIAWTGVWLSPFQDKQHILINPIWPGGSGFL